MADLPIRLAGRDEHVLIVQVPRALNHETADPLRLCVARGLPNVDRAAAVLDMAGVEMISSIGIAALLQVLEVCKDRGAKALLAALPSSQVKFLTMLRLDRKFTVVESVDAAIAQLDC